MCCYIQRLGALIVDWFHYYLSWLIVVFFNVVNNQLTSEPIVAIIGKRPNVEVETGFEHFPENPLPKNVEDMTPQNCVGKGNAFPCGPVCEFEGKTIETLCQWSDSGGITGEILTNVLQKMDEIGVVVRRDGHSSLLMHMGRACP